MASAVHALTPAGACAHPVAGFVVVRFGRSRGGMLAGHDVGTFDDPRRMQKELPAP